MQTDLPRPTPHSARRGDARDGVRVEVITVVWMVIEAAVAITAGILARSILLTAFGFDSVVELLSGFTLLWRLRLESAGRSTEQVENAERRATWVVAVALSLLCVYIMAASIASLALSIHPDTSLAGITLAVVAVPLMAFLVWRKRAIAARIGSEALRADAACSLSCAYMAGALLVGLSLNAAFSWWWADGLAALVLLVWLVPETHEAVRAARSGEAHCSGARD